MKLVEIDKLNPSTYNPRISDPERLDLIELSLRKLGFILPLFATNEGEILSGHQRHYVAKRMGLKKVPVEYIGSNISLKDRKNINILFNLATNDAPKLVYGKQLKEKIKEYNVFEKAKDIPDKDVNNIDEIIPCANLTDVDIKILIEKNYHRFDSYYLNKTKQLSQFATLMPLILNKNLEVINGIGRLELYASAKKKIEKIKCIILPDYLEDFANYMLNYVTMDFDIHNKYKDELRFNSFKRQNAKTAKLGQSYYKKISKDNPGRKFQKEFKQKFIKEYGDYILDFGAGHLRNAAILNENGIKCVPFEPFVLDWKKFNELSYENSVKVCDNFLNEYQKHPDFTSIFLNAVFNSVPFLEDRQKILCILSDIANKNTKIIIWTTSIYKYTSKIKHVMNNSGDAMSKNSNLLLYEKNVTVQDIADMPKVQKYMSDKDVVKLCKPYFKNIRAKDTFDYIYCECTKPKKQKWEKIEEALDFEFNLKHPNGKGLGLNEKAKKIFKEVREKRGE